MITTPPIIPPTSGQLKPLAFGGSAGGSGGGAVVGGAVVGGAITGGVVAGGVVVGGAGGATTVKLPLNPPTVTL